MGWEEGEGGKGKGRDRVRGRPPPADPAPPEPSPLLPSAGEAPHQAPAVALLPLPQRRARGTDSRAEFARSTAAAQTVAPAAAAAKTRELGLYVTSACPSTPLPPLAETSPRHSRRGWDATWTPGFPGPWDAPAPSQERRPRVPRHVGTAVSAPGPALSRSQPPPSVPSLGPRPGPRLWRAGPWDRRDLGRGWMGGVAKGPPPPLRVP